MFKDTQEGQTHYENDGCGELAHNSHQKTSACKECWRNPKKYTGGYCNCECHNSPQDTIIPSMET